MSVDKTLEDRRSTHGDFLDHATATQHLKMVMHDHPGWDNLDVMQREALDMIAHKIGRVLSGDPNFADHWHDIQGYARLIEVRL